ncbi:MAG: hypothetical protein ABI977_03630 [Acidobacteriota bacterium]
MSTKLRRQKSPQTKPANEARPPLLSAESWRVARKGVKLYQTKLKELLEPAYTGMFAAIEVDSGDYFLGARMGEAVTKAREQYSDRQFYIVRIGFRAAFKLRSPRSL